MKIVIVGGGITGLTAGYELVKSGAEVVILEQGNQVGGLAGSFTYQKHTLEKHYHHIFQSDSHIINLNREIGLEDKLQFYPSRNGILYNGELHDFSGPKDILSLPFLTVWEKIALATTLAELKLSSFEAWMEEISADNWLTDRLGERVNSILWRPLLIAKFADSYKKIPMTWFWARLKNRTMKLGYWQGGIGTFVDRLAQKFVKLGGQIETEASVQFVDRKDGEFRIKTNHKMHHADRVILTTPLSTSLKLGSLLPSSFVRKYEKQAYRHALNLVIFTKRPIAEHYWISIHNTDEKFLAMVNQTKLVGDVYGGLRPVYLGNYLDIDSPLFKMNEKQLLEHYLPTIRQICPDFSSKDVKASFKFDGPFGQPIVGLNHQSQIASIETPVKNLYLATMSQVYPADRGTNFAVELGQKVAKHLT